MRKQADFYLVLLYERIYRTFEGGKANEYSCCCMCILLQDCTMARYQMGTVYQKRKKAANAYCKGDAGR
jgi:hypothetical protein